ncbi:MAG: S8 family serine peptidase [Bacteroidetes bacterium]|nr:S8 family serine peptidase [Bacteroidota bacterium]
MKFKISLTILVCLFFFTKLFSQAYYRVYFKDKNFTEYNPFNYLHPKAIERRILNGIDLCDSSDFPINENYLIQVAELSDSIRGTSRWMNAVFINANDKNIKTISNFYFVKKIEKVFKNIQSSVCSINSNDEQNADTILSYSKEKLAIAQTERLEMYEFENRNLRGQGILICIIDVGFKGYKKNPALKHIINRNGIKGTYDFIKKDSYKNGGISHGSSVFTCIAGKTDDIKFGLATEADFLLARTENFMEFISEEENWLMAAEWADKNGADIINSSLGYTTHRYLPENMDGKTAFVSKAAQIASDKGILVISSAGNEGENKWKRITAPGDAKGILTVGAISPSSGIHAGFSSFGPSFDKRIKPELTAYGKVATWTNFGFTFLEGTSFSSPLVAGFAACAKQYFKSSKNEELRKIIIQSADMYPYYDYAHGYGVPKASQIFNKTSNDEATFTVNEDSLGFIIKPIINKLTIKTDSALKKQIYKTKIPDYVFYSITNLNGNIHNYYIWDPQGAEFAYISINKSKWKMPYNINIFYRNYFKQITVAK